LVLPLGGSCRGAKRTLELTIGPAVGLPETFNVGSVGFCFPTSRRMALDIVRDAGGLDGAVATMTKTERDRIKTLRRARPRRRDQAIFAVSCGRNFYMSPTREEETLRLLDKQRARLISKASGFWRWGVVAAHPCSAGVRWGSTPFLVHLDLFDGAVRQGGTNASATPTLMWGTARSVALPRSHFQSSVPVTVFTSI